MTVPVGLSDSAATMMVRLLRDIAWGFVPNGTGKKRMSAMVMSNRARELLIKEGIKWGPVFQSESDD